MAEQSARSATWTGLLVDMGEQAAEVSVTAGDGRLTGRIVGVGRDFFVLEQANRRPVMVAAWSATSVSPRTGSPHRAAALPAGRRRPALDLPLLSALDALADQRAPVAIRAGGATFEGQLMAVGDDVLTIGLTGSPRRLVHVASAALVWCELR